MRKEISFTALIIAILLVAVGCKKTTSNYTNLNVKDYAILQVGKYITYRLDSLTFYYYGQLDTTTSYLAKDSIEAVTTDNLGRPAFVIQRYLNDTTGTGPWTPSETYMAILTPSALEVVENNVRFVKIAAPITTNVNWNGDIYVPRAPYQDLFPFNNSDNSVLVDWNFTYQNINTPIVLASGVYDSSVTVLQEDHSSNVPILDPSVPASKTYWSETYARNIGLVYRHTAMWEYEPPTADGSQTSYKIGFEMTLSIVDHN
jgi:hypothetical protein